MASHNYTPVTAPEIVFTDLNDNIINDDNQNRKSFHSMVNVREIGHRSTTPESTVPTEGSCLTALKDQTEKSSGSQDSASGTWRPRDNGSWTFEIVSLMVSVIAVGGIVGVLASFEGKPLPDWPFNITLNSLIALLATVANANLAIPLQSGLSQLKWMRFKARPAPLTDMEVFDDASRGAWGAIKLLAKARGGLFGSFGAVASIVVLALGPFAQQVATYRSRVVEADTAATIPAALNYTGVLPGDSSSSKYPLYRTALGKDEADVYVDGFVPILPMKSAVYYGLFSESDSSANLRFNCPTGNCTWPAFTTLAVCSVCIDLTPYLTRYCSNGASENGDVSKCGWQLPQGALLHSHSDVFSLTSKTPSNYGDMPYTDILRLIFMGTEAQSGQPLNYNPWAKQCTLHYCLQNFNSSVVNGVLTEKVTATTLNSSVVNISRSKGNDPVTLTATDNVTYAVGMGASLGIKSWFGDLFASGSATRNSSYTNFTRTDNTVVVNLTVGISEGTTYFDSDIIQTFYWDYYEYANGLEMAMSDLATSMTVAFRSFNGAVPIKGRAFTFESYVHVRWGWITLPVLVVLLTALFFVAAVVKSRQSGTKLWKSSALAMLFHGLDQETRDRCTRPASLGQQKREARGVMVRLDQGVDGESMLRCC